MAGRANCATVPAHALAVTCSQRCGCGHHRRRREGAVPQLRSAARRPGAALLPCLRASDDPELATVLAQRPSEVSLDLGLVQAGVAGGVFFCEGIPAWLCQRIQARLNTSTCALLQQVQKVSDRIASHAGVVLFVLLPAFAAGLALLLRDRSFSYTEHLVFALHLHAFWFLAITFIMLGVEWAPWMALLLLVVPACSALAFRRVYGGPRCSLALRRADAGARLAGAGDRCADRRPLFCPACGQESNVRPPRLGEFLQQFGGAYFATEGALWRTLKLLLAPGELTRQ